MARSVVDFFDEASALTPLLTRFGAAQPTDGRAWEADFGPKQGWVEERDPAGSRRRG
ncbi:MAG: hypothetical protein M3436_18950 [Pseudomonadota bacterium]|nr:hypothetical protein [Pseudomonadota bacterium]